MDRNKTLTEQLEIVIDNFNINLLTGTNNNRKLNDIQVMQTKLTSLSVLIEKELIKLNKMKAVLSGEELESVLIDNIKQG